MSARTSRSLCASLLLTLVAGTAPWAQAQDPLPPAKQLIERFMKESGGDVWKRHKSSRMKASMEVPAAGLKAELEVVQVYPNSVMEKTNMPGLGELKTGYNNGVAWSIDPMQGPKVLTGAQADAMRENADPATQFRMSPEITSSETVEKTTINDQACYKVKHTYKSSRVAHDCYSVETGLLVATTTTQATAMGEVEVTHYAGEYKELGGMKRPTVVTSQMMGQQMTLRIISWEWDTVEPSEVDLPAEIKALVEKKP